MSNVFGLQQKDEVGIYEHDIVDHIFEETKNEVEDSKLYFQSKLSLNNNSPVKFNIDKMFKNRRLKLKKMRKHGNSEQAKPIKAVLLITPANPDKQLKTDVLVDASKTNDHTNVKTAQLNVSTVANEDKLKLNSSNICDELKAHLLSKSVDVTKESQQKRRNISTVAHQAHRVKQPESKIASTTRYKSTETSTCQTDGKQTNKLREISTSHNFRKHVKKSYALITRSFDKDRVKDSEDIKSKLQDVFKTESRTSRIQNNWCRPLNNDAHINSLKLSNFLSTVRSNVIKNKINMHKILDNLKQARFNNTMDANQFVQNKLMSKRRCILTQSEKVQQHMDKITQSNKRKINQIVHKCYGVEFDGVQTLNRLQFEREFDKIYREEFDNTLKLLKEIDFAHGNVLDMLYHKKQQDIRDDNELADIVAKEYRAGGACR